MQEKKASSSCTSVMLALLENMLWQAVVSSSKEKHQKATFKPIEAIVLLIETLVMLACVSLIWWSLDRKNAWARPVKEIGNDEDFVLVSIATDGSGFLVATEVPIFFFLALVGFASSSSPWIGSLSLILNWTSFNRAGIY